MPGVPARRWARRARPAVLLCPLGSRRPAPIRRRWPFGLRAGWRRVGDGRARYRAAGGTQSSAACLLGGGGFLGGAVLLGGGLAGGGGLLARPAPSWPIWSPPWPSSPSSSRPSWRPMWWRSSSWSPPSWPPRPCSRRRRGQPWLPLPPDPPRRSSPPGRHQRSASADPPPGWPASRGRTRRSSLAVRPPRGAPVQDLFARLVASLNQVVHPFLCLIALDVPGAHQLADDLLGAGPCDLP